MKQGWLMGAIVITNVYYGCAQKRNNDMEITKQASIKFITNRFYKTKRVPRKLKKKIKKRLTFALNYFDGYYNFQDGYFTGVSDFKLKDH